MAISTRAVVRQSLYLVTIALALVMGSLTRAHAQSCSTTIPATVQITLSGGVTFPGGVVEPISNVLTQTQNANECTDNPSGLSPLVCSYRTPFTALLAAKILQVVDRTPDGRGVFDDACGNVNVTLTMGDPASPLASGTVAMTFTPPSAVSAVINMTTILDPSVFQGVPGHAALSEVAYHTAVGQVKGTGLFKLELAGDSATVPFKTTYQLTGSPSFPAGGTGYVVSTDLAYDCNASTITSKVCLTASVASVPLPRSAAFGLGIGLLALGGFVLVRKRSRARS